MGIDPEKSDSDIQIRTRRAECLNHFPFLLASEYVTGGAVFAACGWLLAGMDISIVFAGLMWGLGAAVLLLVLTIQCTTIVIDRARGELNVTWRLWWRPGGETKRCSLSAISDIRLRDVRKDYEDGRHPFIHGVTLHNWQIWAILVDGDEVPLTPTGHASGFFDQRLAMRLAGLLGVGYRKEVYEAPL